jgi:hypothetical protein
MYKGKNHKVPNGTIRICDKSIEINSKDIEQYPTTSTSESIGDDVFVLVVSVVAIIVLAAFSFSWLIREI